jgi:YebC/PmpR family DNA-binding regulatory protein
MAGHSHFANIQHKKDNVDKKRSKVFTRLVRDIITAIKTSGGEANVDLNPKLKMAISIAKSYNLPKDKIENAIKTALSKNESENQESVRYNGTFAGGVACIIECSTDNRNRTIGEVRTIFTKADGKIVDSGGVEFMFQKIGYFEYSKESFETSKIIISFDEFFEYCLGEEINNVSELEDKFIAECSFENFERVYQFFQKNPKLTNPSCSEIRWKANEYLDVNQEKREFLQKIEEKLEDLNDVERVYWNVA